MKKGDGATCAGASASASASTSTSLDDTASHSSSSWGIGTAFNSVSLGAAKKVDEATFAEICNERDHAIALALQQESDEALTVASIMDIKNDDGQATTPFSGQNTSLQQGAVYEIDFDVADTMR